MSRSRAASRCLGAAIFLVLCMGLSACSNGTPQGPSPSAAPPTSKTASDPPKETPPTLSRPLTYRPLAPGNTYFAYVDEKGYPSIYNLTDHEVAWRSKWAQHDVTTDDSLTWSAKGQLLVYTCTDPVAQKVYTGILDAATIESRYVSMDKYFDPGGVSWEWSPSGNYVVAMEPAYMNLGISVISVQESRLVKTYVADPPVWSRSERLGAYSRYVGKDPKQAYVEIYTFDVSTGRDTLVFKTEPGDVAWLVRWTDDDSLIFRHRIKGEWSVRDTKGRTYQDGPEYQVGRGQSPDKPPEQFWKGLRPGGWDKSANGQWLISAGTTGADRWIQLVLPGSTQANQVVKGSCPLWRPVSRK